MADKDEIRKEAEASEEPEEEKDIEEKAGEKKHKAKKKAEKEAAEKEEKEAAEKPEGDSGKAEDDESWEEKYTRLMAEFQNFKKRTEKEKADVYSFANEKIMTDLLAVLDNFERALEHDCGDKPYAEGMEMIFKQLVSLLEGAGLEEIEAKGEPFDPNFHNAVMTDKNSDFESGVVTEVMQKGYLLKDKVIRPAMVKVNE